MSTSLSSIYREVQARWSMVDYRRAPFTSCCYTAFVGAQTH